MRHTVRFAVFCCVFLAHAAFAAEPQQNLSTVVITASADPQAAITSPSRVQVIDRRRIEQSGATTLSQLLQEHSPTQVQSQPGHFTRFSMRGLSSGKFVNNTFRDQVLLLIDGNRSGTGNVDLIPMGTIERIEILRGPASRLYGGAATGGVINVITRRGKGKPQGHAEAAYGSFSSRKASAGVSGSTDDARFGYAVAGQASAASAYSMADRERYENSHYNKSSGSATLTYRPEAETEAHGLGIVSGVYDTGSPGFVGNFTPDDSVVYNYGHGALELKTRLSSAVDIKGSIFANNNVYTYNDRGMFAGRYRYDTLTSGGRLVSGIGLGEVGGFDAGRLALGTEYVYSRARQGGSSISEPDNTMDMLSLFAEHSLEMGDVVLQYGLRYDTYKASVHASSDLEAPSSSKHFDQLTASAGLTWWVLDWLGLKASTGTAYTPPSPAELAGDYNFWGTRYLGNPDLKAEKGFTSEVGLEFERWGFTGSTGYFVTRLKDRISTRKEGSWPDPVTETYINQGRQNLAGFEGSLEYAYPFTLHGYDAEFSAFTHGEYFTQRSNRGDKRRTTRITDLPRYKASAGLGMRLGMVRLDGTVESVGPHLGYDYDLRDYTNFKRFEIFSARLTVKPAPSLSVYLDVHNIADTRYGYKPEFPMPGRSFMTGIRYEF